LWYESDTGSAYVYYDSYWVELGGSAGPTGPTGPTGSTGATGSTGPTGSSAGVLSFMIDGGGAVVTTGVKGYIEIPFACTINKWTLLGDVTGSAVIDIWKDTYTNYPPTVTDTITASAKPTITSSTKGQSSTLTGWTTSVAAGDILAFNVDSCSSITNLSISLGISRT
jgi:hypothetical protein